MKKYELIIFDCDGTLVDTEPITNKIIAAMIAELGVNITDGEALQRFLGRSLADIFAYIRSEGIDVEEGKFEVDFRQRCLQMFQKELRPFDGVEDLLSSLTIPYCIGSNGPRKKMEQTLPIAGLRDFFSDERIFSAYDIKAWKPKPDLFIHACSKMGVAPEWTLVIEDSISGIMGAVSAGIDVWAFNPHLHQELYLDRVANFTTMLDIKSALLRLTVC